ncbi:MAG: membrane protein insertion efficiency factor YidD [Synergistaceae bacterium]|nr:membrane protein insertion efficiency factor YidD [Synergistaceae bacterium]
MRSKNPLVAVAVISIKAYRKFISPLLGQSCRFYPTCSRYALDAYERHGFVKGTILTVCRLARCGPWHPGGVDPVPEKARLRKMFRGR